MYAKIRCGRRLSVPADGGGVCLMANERTRKKEGQKRCNTLLSKSSRDRPPVEPSAGGGGGRQGKGEERGKFAVYFQNEENP